MITNVEARGKFRGELKRLVERALLADQLIEDTGTLKTEKVI